MLKPPEHLVAQVERAAELRAAGHSWEYVAREIERPYQTVYSWPRFYRDYWNGLIADARRAVAVESSTEARAVLRNMLRSDDEKMQRDAACELLKSEPKLEPAKPLAKSEFHRIADFLEGLPDDERTSLLERLSGGPDPVVDALVEVGPTGSP